MSAILFLAEPEAQGTLQTSLAFGICLLQRGKLLTPTTHDLLRLTHVSAVVSDGPLPGWARRSLGRTPWVVVCRLPPHDGLLPVGIRGNARHERHLAWLPPDAVAECVTPEMLAGRRGWVRHARRADVPALTALEPVAKMLACIGVPWGPAGSVAFELATGQPTATSASDLDLVLRPAVPLARDCARKIVADFADVRVRADVLIETIDGAMSLVEFAGAAPDIVLRTADGPRRVKNL